MLSIEAAALRFENFSCRFELTVAEHERVALIGESGSGKSTLLNLIAGFLLPDSGKITWKGENVLPLPPHQRPVTILFQDNNLFSHLNVFHNVAIGIHPGARLDDAQRATVHAVLERVGLAGFESRQPPSLSGGQQQRVALARCLLRKRPLLTLDEPFSALDVDTREKMLQLTDELVRENQLTLLLVTHNRAEADAIGARQVHVRDGRLG